MLGSDVRAGGFPSVEAKLAFVRGAVDAASGFPNDLLDAVRSGRGQGYDGPPLILKTAVLSEAEFVTDRGRRRLPAWEVHAEGVPAPIWVLDPPVKELIWGPNDIAAAGSVQRWLGCTAVVDGRSVTLSFSGSPREYSDYPDAEVLEADGAVAIIPNEVSKVPPGQFRRLNAEHREVTVTLSEPLGNRVLLDGHGVPVMVES
ncbi:MAG: hypothetical protein ACREHV_06510 [Rhizomicrobium sp.]